MHESKLKKGDLFGLSSLIQKEPSLLTVCALSDIQVIAIEIEAMQELLKENPEVAQSLENMADNHEKKISKNLFSKS